MTVARTSTAEASSVPAPEASTVTKSTNAATIPAAAPIMATGFIKAAVAVANGSGAEETCRKPGGGSADVAPFRTRPFLDLQVLAKPARPSR
jgi:hypothetical protein